MCVCLITDASASGSTDSNKHFVDAVIAVGVLYGALLIVLTVAVVLIVLFQFKKNGKVAIFQPDIRRPSTETNEAYGILNDGKKNVGVTDIEILVIQWRGSILYPYHNYTIKLHCTTTKCIYTICSRNNSLNN